MMKRTAIRVLALCLALFCVMGTAMAAGNGIKTYLTFRVTTPSQSSVVYVGQDLQIEVGVDGVEPTSWQWYFEGNEITENGDQRIYNILNAQMEDAGIYRMLAYVDEKMVLSVDVNVRVIDTALLPTAGDDSLPVCYAFAAAALGALVLAAVIRKRRAA